MVDNRARVLPRAITGEPILISVPVNVIQNIIRRYKKKFYIVYSKIIPSHNSGIFLRRLFGVLGSRLECL